MGPSLNPSLLLAAIPATAFGACLLPLLLQRFGRTAAAVGAATVMAACLALLLPLAPAALTGTPNSHASPGYPPTVSTSACASTASGCCSAC
jgi:hypothetical protein